MEFSDVGGLHRKISPRSVRIGRAVYVLAGDEGEVAP